MDGTGVLLGLSLFLGYPLADAPAEHIGEVGVEHYSPLHADRQLHLDNAQWLLRQKTLFGGRVRLRLGVDVTRGHGSITQLQAGADGKLQEVMLDSPGLGVGPLAEAHLGLLDVGPVHLGFDVGAAVLWFDRGFPAGGLHYDGKYSLGPSVGWSMGSYGRLTVGARWMHLSNGHGLVAENPSFEGRGVTVRWELPLGRH